MRRIIRSTTAKNETTPVGWDRKRDHQAGRRSATQGGLYARCHIVGKVTTHSLRKTFATRLSQRVGGYEPWVLVFRAQLKAGRVFGGPALMKRNVS